MDALQTTALAGFLCLAVGWDVLERRIPNRLVVAFGLGGLVLAGRSGGPTGLALAAGGFLVGLGLLLVPFASGWVGAGDAKFFGVVGTFLGPAVTLEAFLLGTALGAPLAVAVIWRARGAVHATAAVLASTGAGAILGGAPPPSQAKLAYAVPLALGVVAALVLEATGYSLFQGGRVAQF